MKFFLMLIEDVTPRRTGGRFVRSYVRLDAKSTTLMFSAKFDAGTSSAPAVSGEGAGRADGGTESSSRPVTARLRPNTTLSFRAERARSARAVEESLSSR